MVKVLYTNLKNTAENVRFKWYIAWNYIKKKKLLILLFICLAKAMVSWCWHYTSTAIPHL